MSGALLDPASAKKEALTDALAKVRNNSHGVYFAIKYMSAGQQLKKAAAECCSRQASSALVGNRLKKLLETASSLPTTPSKLSDWTALHSSLQELKSASGNHKAHEDSLQQIESKIAVVRDSCEAEVQRQAEEIVSDAKAKQSSTNAAEDLDACGALSLAAIELNRAVGTARRACCGCGPHWRGSLVALAARLCR